MNVPLTHFASPERVPIEVIQRQAKTWAALPFVSEVLKAAAGCVVVLNQQRQIVFATENILPLTKVGSLAGLLGQRPGEAFACLHATDCAGGCGTSEFCQECGAVQSILEAFGGQESSRECRLLRMGLGGTEALDLRVCATPFEVKGEPFCVFALTDVSAEKRRQVLERAFFHDLINTASGLEGLVESIQRDAPTALQEDLGLVRMGFQDLYEQVRAQRDLASAERHELKPVPGPVNSRLLLAELQELYARHPLARDRVVAVDPRAAAIEFTVDRTLLGRVLVNLLRNALEASRPGDTVDLGAETNGAGGAVRFWVRNPEVMPRSVQLQIFQRSFSTKGAGRGTGTYAVRLLTERYLGGQVAFRSTPQTGTVFEVTLPSEPGEPLSGP